ncbi:MAG: L-aspartate oxidase [Sulfurospirillum sp.]|nr:L-aspartate oxidase [Sulfurospirillum sp.]
MKNYYDVIIIGSGVAGLHTALKLSQGIDALVLSKDYAWECNTFYAQGGVAVAKDTADVTLHVADTLAAGAGHCDEDAVNLLCSMGKTVIDSFIQEGFVFDTDSDGNLLYTQEAAHSTNRILHASGDATGRAIHHFLMEKLKFPILYNTQVTDLLIDEGVCYGVKVYHANKKFNLYAKKVVIASGGVGSLYAYHTNARTISADMHGICLRHGIALRDMEMMQFHPTVFVKSDAVRKQLLSEALRGEGAMIVDSDGKRFLFDYDSRGELSPRNLVSQAIFDHAQKTKKEIFLDLRSFDCEHFKKRFPSIYFNMKNVGYDLPQTLVPISPAFHYAMGGIKTDLDGKIAGVADLYAIGEVACTGVHGANRLASNSLLEGFVFSTRVASNIEETLGDKKRVVFAQNNEKLIRDGDKLLKNELRAIMWQDAGIVREKKRLKKALNRVEEMLELQIGKLIGLRLLASRAIIQSALAREHSLGAHYILGEEKI